MSAESAELVSVADAIRSGTWPGSGANAYMQLSGTSMAAGVVSGAVALLLEHRPHIKPADAKAILQVTSSFLPNAGVVGAGAGKC